MSLTAAGCVGPETAHPDIENDDVFGIWNPGEPGDNSPSADDDDTVPDEDDRGEGNSSAQTQFTVVGPGPWGAEPDASAHFEFAGGDPGVDCDADPGQYSIAFWDDFWDDQVGGVLDLAGFHIIILEYTGPGSFDLITWDEIDPFHTDFFLSGVIQGEESYAFSPDVAGSCIATIDDDEVTGSFKCTGLPHFSPTTGQEEHYQLSGTWNCGSQDARADETSL